MFDYQNATLEQLIEHIKVASSASITRMKRYYEQTGNTVVVHKINLAREHIKLERVQKRMEELKNV